MGLAMVLWKREYNAKGAMERKERYVLYIYEKTLRA